MYKIPLYEQSNNDGETGRCIGRVTSTHNLDQWNGSNHQYGGTGHHSGVGKTRAGQFFQVHTSQWQGARPDYAEIISEAEAKNLVMSVNDADLYQELFGEPVPDLD